LNWIKTGGKIWERIRKGTCGGVINLLGADIDSYEESDEVGENGRTLEVSKPTIVLFRHRFSRFWRRKNGK